MKVFIYWLLIVLVTSASAKEAIHSFHSDIEISQIGQITITETLLVKAENIAINRGIFRDFPTQYFGKYLTQNRVGFKVLLITRNGQIEPYHTQEMSNGIRIYIGSSDTMLQPGVHEYQITYQTDKQIGYFDDYDEFYWNVTGTGWAFPILKASAHITLPNEGHTQVTDQRAWTGYQGEQSQHYELNNDDTGLGFVTTEALKPNQGLTVGIQFPKGILIPEPFDISTFLADNLLWILSLLVFLFYFGFYLSAWYRHGKDPEKGVILVRFYPPKGLSPAAVHYIDNEKTNSKTLTAALLNLAVKGYITITQLKNKYQLKLIKSKKKLPPLSKGERVLKNTLFSGRSKQLTISKKYNSKLKKAERKLFSSLKKEYQKKCFVDNRSYVIWGWVISFACFFLGTLLIFNPLLSASDLFLTIIIYTILFVLGLAFLITAPIITSFIILGLLAASYFEIIHFFIHQKTWIFFVLSLLGVNVLFTFLLRATTPFGRHIKDQIDGLKLYMKSAEEHRLNTMNPPDRTIEYYEQLLPYATALGLENHWSEKFADVINLQTTDTNQHQPVYQPSWYHNQLNNKSFSGFSANEVSRSLRKTVKAAAVIPSASRSASSGSYTSSSYTSSSSSSSYSSSSSSGSSGGGGGGGGGGGW